MSLNEHQERALRTGLPVVADALVTAQAILAAAHERARPEEAKPFEAVREAAREATRLVSLAHEALGLGPLRRDPRIVLLEQVQRIRVALGDDEAGPEPEPRRDNAARQMAELRLLATQLERAVVNMRPARAPRRTAADGRG